MRIFLFSSVLVLSGCLSNDVLMSSSVAHENVERISQLRIGMTQEEVYQIMRYPAAEDHITTGDGCYDIWFYTTKSNVLDQNRSVARNLTPLIFKNGIFVGMGHDYYNGLVKKTKEPALAPPPPPPEPEEDVDLEKNLTTPPVQNQIPAKPGRQDKNKSSKPLSMSSKKRTQPEADTPADDDSSKPRMDERDLRMLDQEREENFNDW